MQGNPPDRVLDPVCAMAVEVAAAEAAGLVVPHEGRTYAFCGAGCRCAFLDEPETYSATAEVASRPADASASLPVIDEGMRRWYENCSCCLSEVYPEIKAALDAEHAAVAVPRPHEHHEEVATK